MITFLNSSYQYRVWKRTRLDSPGGAGLDVGLSETFDRLRAGSWYLNDPRGEWARIEADEIVRAPIADWVLARLLRLVQEAEPGVALADFLVFDQDAIRFPFEVRDGGGRVVAEPSFSVAKGDARWRGRACSYPVGRAVIAELEDRLCAEPDQLAEYRLEVSWRAALGWNGRRFRGQRTVKRPDFYSRANIAARREPKGVSVPANLTPPERFFTVRDLRPSDEEPSRKASKRRKRFTDVFPPPDLWRATPNWRRALEEEGRPGQDESTLKPADDQDHIGEEVDYTAGEAWLPDGRIVPALIGVTVAGEPEFIACFDDALVWEFQCRPGGIGEPRLTPEQCTRFPLGVVSRLSRSRRDPAAIIRVIVDERGAVSPWPLDEGST